MSLHVRKTILALALILGATLATPVSAQELSFGYQVQHFSSEGDSLNAPLGISLNFAAPSSGILSVVGQVDWSRKSESGTLFGTSLEATANFTTFAGGVRLSARGTPAVTPFMEALFGVMRSSGSANIAGANVGSGSETDPVLQFGGGVAVPLAGAFGIFGQVDYRRVFPDSTGVNVVRFVAGARLVVK